MAKDGTSVTGPSLTSFTNHLFIGKDLDQARHLRQPDLGDLFCAPSFFPQQRVRGDLFSRMLHIGSLPFPHIPDSTCELLEGGSAPSPGHVLITLHLEYCHSTAGVTVILQPCLHAARAKAGSLKHRPKPRSKTAPCPPNTHARAHTHVHSGFDAQCSCLCLPPESALEGCEGDSSYQHHLPRRTVNSQEPCF